MKKIIFLMALMLVNANAVFKLGVTAGPHAMIAEKVKELAKKQGLDIDVVEFNDFVLPNIALNEGSLNANSYQHQPFLDAQVKDRGFKLVSVGKTVLMPMGGYSKKVKSVADLKEKAVIGIPNDPTNGARALLLLAKQGLIEVKDKNLPGIFDITKNPKNLVIKEMDAPQLPRSLDDLDLAVVNTDWIVLAKMDPESALFSEGKESPYANIIVVRESTKDNDDVKTLIKVYQSKEIETYVKDTFKGAVLFVG